MESGSLRRVLGRADAAVLGFGAMIGWGWVILAGVWVAQAGVMGAGVAFLIGALAITVIGFTYAELASALPFAGGEHAYAERAFGPAASFIATWAIAFGYVSVVAFEAIALPVALAYLWPDIRAWPLYSVAGYQVHASEIAIGAAAALIIMVLNILGIRLAARVQSVVVVFLLAAGAVLILGGIVHFNPPAEGAPVFKGWPMVAAVMITVPFLFVGFDVIPQSAEEIDTPRREIGSALVASIVGAVVFYLLIVFAVGLAPFDPQTADLPTADAASAYWGSSKASAFVVLAGIGGIITSWNAFLIGGSRAMFALARSGQLPGALARIHPKYGTPYVAIAVIGALSVIAPALGRNSLVWIVNAGGFGIVLAYLFVAASFLALRRREPSLERPYKAPGGAAMGVVALVMGLGLFALYLPPSPSALKWPVEWGLFGGWFAIGAMLFLLRGRR